MPLAQREGASGGTDEEGGRGSVTLHVGDIVVDKDGAKCVVQAITHGEEVYYWLVDAATGKHIGGMCEELMKAYRRVKA